MAHPTSNGLMNACEYAIKKENIEYQRKRNLRCYGRAHNFQQWQSRIYTDLGKLMSLV